MNNYNSYMEAMLYKRALAARHERNKIFCIPFEIKSSISTLYDGRKYINPATMSIILDCDIFELMNAIENHKRHLASIDTSMLDQYGNRNYEVQAKDKIYIQGWINFLSLPCFNDSIEAKEVVRVLKETS